MKKLLTVLVLSNVGWLPSCATSRDSKTTSKHAELCLASANTPLKAPASVYKTEDALHFAQISCLAYGEPNITAPLYKSLGYTRVELIEDEETSTQMYILFNDNTIVLAYRGTESSDDGKPNPKDMATNFMSALVKFSPKLEDLGEVHEGFQKSTASLTEKALQSLRALDWLNKNLYITGHSLGGALAEHAAASIAAHGVNINSVYLFGSPLVGNKKYATNYDATMKNRTFRVINGSDPVPNIMENEKKNNRIYVSTGKVIHLTGGKETFPEKVPAGSNWKDHSALSYISTLKNQSK